MRRDDGIACVLMFIVALALYALGVVLGIAAAFVLLEAIVNA